MKKLLLWLYTILWIVSCSSEPTIIATGKFEKAEYHPRIFWSEHMDMTIVYFEDGGSCTLYDLVDIPDGIKGKEIIITKYYGINYHYTIELKRR